MGGHLDPKEDHRRVASVARWTRAVVLIVWVVVGFYIVLGTWASPLMHSRKTVINVATLAPEGWAFFTRNPELPNTLVYKNNAGNWTTHTKKNASASAWFGLRRHLRKQDMEVAIVQGGIPAGAWVAMKLSGAELLRAGESLAAVTISNTARKPVLCGEFLLQQLAPVPWAWGRIRRPFSMPSRLARVEVVCEDGISS